MSNIVKLQIAENDDRRRHTIALGGRILVKGDGAVCCKAARALQAEGMPDDTILEFCRGDEPSLRGPLGVFAKLTVEQGYSPRFTTYKPMLERPMAACGDAQD